jgi:anthranilate/para-aminobenzoate synthase component I
MGKAGYCRGVRAIQRHILDGDIYQANLAHHFETGYSGDAFDLYRRLTRINPSPMAAFVDLGAAQVVSASPERLFQIRGRRVETWPIAGTAPRRGRPGERQALRGSAKDRAEHVMLVDLERNDLGRVCMPGSVKVPRFQVLQSYSHVHHLVSQVVGTLLPGKSLPQVLAAGFPGGSITGAPKIRSMEIIAALEGRARGWYTGSLGWWDSRSRSADLNILIRTLFVAKGRAGASVGAGIVLDSKPEAEWRETQAKAGALLSALGLKA